MKESDIRIVDHKELTQFSSKNFHKALFQFLHGFNQIESIQIVKTIVRIADSFQKGKSFDFCDKIYKKDFLEKYIGRNENAHNVGLLHYLYFDGIWFRYKMHLLETEKKYSYELINYDTHIQDSYLSELIRMVDEIFDLILTNFSKYNELQKIVIDSNLVKKDITKPTARQVALFYYYLQVANLIPSFENHPINQTEAFKEIGIKHNISPKNFRNVFYEVLNNSDRKSGTKYNIKNIEKVIVMLVEFEPAKKVAEKELQEITHKYKNNKALRKGF